MRLGGDPVGRWGLALLGITAIAGVLLAAHGWSASTAGAAPTLATGSAPASTRPAATPPASSPPPSSPPAAASPSASAQASAGPLLSSEPYAHSAFLVWPGQPSTAAKQALTGLSVKVHRQGGGVSVTAGVIGQPASPPHVYQNGAHVYVVEVSLGDDSGNADYSLGDDGLVVTNKQGRIVQ